MKSKLLAIVSLPVSLFFLAAGAAQANAQIMYPIVAHINHSFVVGNTTLPPGKYTFRMVQDSDLQLMSVSNADDKVHVEFIVSAATDNRTPQHPELCFRKYGNTEFLSKVFETGSKTGVAVAHSSHEEDRLVKQGQHSIEHTEDEPS